MNLVMLTIMHVELGIVFGKRSTEEQWFFGALPWVVTKIGKKRFRIHWAKGLGKSEKVICERMGRSDTLGCNSIKRI